MNVCFEYLYRDAGNYKNWGDVIFSNPKDLAIAGIMAEVQGALFEGCYFLAKQTRVPDLHFDKYDPDLDHGWHEAYSFTSTSRQATDPDGRTIEEFIDCLKSNRPGSCCHG